MGLLLPDDTHASDAGTVRDPAGAKGVLINNLVTFCWELWCSSIPHESHEEIY